MMRLLLTAVALVASPIASRAGEPAILLKLQPMAAPKPALKYQLLPEVRELNPGNPAQYYVRCFAEQRNFFFGKEATAERHRYLTAPLSELPAENLRRYGGNALFQADWAARLDTLDWQVLQRVQNEGMDLVLPELGPLRVLAIALQCRFRGQIAGKHYDEAVVTAKTMFAFARHLGEYPAEVANLVGLSVAQQTLSVLEEMVQQPGSPNLYWALTDLPTPIVDVRKGLQGDRALMAADLKLLRDDANMSDADLEKVISRLSGTLGFVREQAGLPPHNFRAALQARIKDTERVRTARTRLLQAGGSVGLTWWTLKPTQIILLDEKRNYEIQRDERLKLLGLAPWQIETLYNSKEPGQNNEGLFKDLLPHIIKVRRAQARVEQRIALLRHVEALRLYAASHEGRLPENLTDVGVPLPNDPFTGKPFLYQVEGPNAHLWGSPPLGEEQQAGFGAEYQIRMQ